MPIELTTSLTAACPAAVEDLVRRTGFFSAAEVAIARELLDDLLEKGAGSDYVAVFARDGRDGPLVGYACWGEIPCTEARYDLYWIAVDPDRQGEGIGQVLLAHVEASISKAGGAAIYVDTSSREQYGPTRAFYERSGYEVAAHLTDFYRDGDGKVVYAKRLTTLA
jgi:ribosomal protein S18 acetylase RimI-like enzyme